jgi:SEC-C motif
MRKVGRNEPCPCGSGKKHKKCCAEAGKREKPRLLFSAPQPVTGPVKIDLPGLAGHRQSLILQNYSPNPKDPRHSEDIEGEAGKYRIVITLHRPGIRLRPEADYAIAEHMEGDSHLAIAKPAHPHPDLPSDTHVRLTTEIANESFTFVCSPNQKGFLGKLELDSIDADNFNHAAGRAYRATTLALSGMSFRYDVPLEIYQMDVIELRTGSVRISMVTPFREVSFLGDPTRVLSQEFLKYASYYREGLNSNSLNYQFLCFYKIIEGIRKRRQRLTGTAVEAAKTRDVKVASRAEDCLPHTREEQIKWLNGTFSTEQAWDDEALNATFPPEVLGIKISKLIKESEQLDTVRNKVAHAILRSEEPTLSIDEASNVELVNKWLPLTKSIARYLLNKEFPDQHPEDPPKPRIVKLYRSRNFTARAEEGRTEYLPISGSLEHVRDLECELHLGKVRLPPISLNMKEEGVGMDNGGRPTVIYVGMELDDEGVERILFTGYFDLSPSSPTWKIYGKRLQFG